jgi:hypothetical protein
VIHLKRARGSDTCCEEGEYGVFRNKKHSVATAGID